MRTVLHSVWITLASAYFGLLSPAAQAQEVGRVVSLTPSVRPVQVQKQVCGLDGYRNQVCTTQTVTQTVTDGFIVQYEYAGQLYQMFSATDPGPFVAVNVAPQTYSHSPAYVGGYNHGHSAYSGYAPVYPPVYPPIAHNGYARGYIAPVPIPPVIVIRGGGRHFSPPNHDFHRGYHNHHGHNGGHGGGWGHRR